MLVSKTNRIITGVDLLSFVWNDDVIAFVKHDICENGEYKWFVYSSDGFVVAEVESRDEAFVVARQNDLCAYSAH